MKRFLALLLFAVLMPSVLFAAPLGKATDDFDNARPDKMETSWGRFVADSLRASAKTDLALVSAAVLRKGTLQSGPVDAAAVTALLAFPDDQVVTMRVTGAQLRAALERAVQAYPTASPAMLHLSGLTAAFNAQAPLNRRVTLVRVRGAEVKDADAFSLALPVSLAEGGAGYYTIWNGRDASRTGQTLIGAVSSYIHAQGAISPDNNARFTIQ